MNDNKFDAGSFWAGAFLAVIVMAMMLSFVIDRLIITPEACFYAEDLCYPEYENGKWSIVEGER